MAVEQQLLNDAVALMLLGMGTVYVFLTLLVYLTSLMSVLVNRFAPVKVLAVPAAATPEPADDQTLLAVITAAIHAHRNRR